MRHRGALLPCCLALAWILFPAAARAAGAPQIPASWTSEVAGNSARLDAQVNPEGSETAYHFELLTEAQFAENGQTFAGALKVPSGAEPLAGSSFTVQTVSQIVTGLAPETIYRYRVLAHNGAGSTERGGPSLTFTTEPAGGAPLLADGRGWEMVSPVEKNGGQIEGPGQIAGGGVMEAAIDGDAVTFGSTGSFGEAPQGAGVGSQYIARRSSSGWTTENISLPMVSGSYGSEPDGVPYQLFSPELARGLVLNGEHCRGPREGECPIANPPLLGSGAPGGYQDYYLRNDEDGSYSALLTAANADLGLPAKNFSVSVAGASPDLSHVVLSTCAALTPGAFEEKEGEGCAASHPNLYEWSGGGLTEINFTDSELAPTPPARLAAQSGAISTDGQRIYFTDPETGDLFLREAGKPVRSVAGSRGEAAVFQIASASGSLAFFIEGESLFRFDAEGGPVEQIAAGVEGVLGASEDGSTVYYQSVAGLYRWRSGAATLIAAGPEAADSGDYPPTLGTARVSADGSHLLFVSERSLAGYDNTDQVTGRPDSEVFLWSAGGAEGGTLACVSCNPTNERPLGPSSIPGSYANGSESSAGAGRTVIDSHKPRDLSVDGERVFFDSDDALVPQDTDERPDVYEWEAAGEGSCARTAGCVNLISGGRSPEGATFLDASADGSDAFFITDASLVPSDPGSVDLYDARVGGGFPVASPPIACVADACQTVPPEPEDPLPGTLAPGSGQPRLHLPKPHRDKHRGKHRKHHVRRKRGHHRTGRRHSEGKA